METDRWHPLRGGWSQLQDLVEFEWCRTFILLSCFLFPLAHARRRRRRMPVQFRSVDDSQVRAFVGVGLCIHSLSAAWILLPIFIDHKIAADPALPGLTEETLTITTTAIFGGWVVGSLFLQHLMSAFDKAQLIVAGCVGLLMVALATATLPHLTAGNLAVFTAVRFVQGLLQNIVFLETVYVQEAVPPGWGNAALVYANVGFCLVDILQAFLCGGPMLLLDWRLQVFLSQSVPLLLALLIGFPKRWEILCSLPAASKALWKKEEVSAESTSLTAKEWHHGMALASGFLASCSGYWGLSYSAGQLSPNKYRSMMFFSAADIFGYLLALSASSLGRSRVQAGAFFLATVCLFLCSTGEPGSALVMGSAMLGRICLDLCFTTIYAFVEIFSESARKKVLPACEMTMRIGGTLAPYAGTLPPSISCKLFSFLCLAAALGSLQLPDQPHSALKKKLADW